MSRWTPPRTGFLHTLLRLPFRLLPDEWTVPILRGPARGYRWVVGSGNHSYWLGGYEAAKQTRLVGAVSPGDVVYDLGAHAGFFTLLSSALVGPCGRVLALEPNPNHIARLRHHIALNEATNVEVLEAAASDRTGRTSFRAAGVSGRLHAQGDITVETVRLDDVAGERAPPPNAIKIDVEGSEDRVLRGAAHLLRTHRPTVLIDTHGSKIRQRCTKFLQEHDYAVCPIRDDETLTDTDELWAQPV